MNFFLADPWIKTTTCHWLIKHVSVKDKIGYGMEELLASGNETFSLFDQIVLEPLCFWLGYGGPDWSHFL